MSQARLNHVSIVAHEMQESVDFYTNILGLEYIPSPKFSTDVEWLRSDNMQLHLFERDITPPKFHHFALYANNFESVYKNRKREIL